MWKTRLQFTLSILLVSCLFSSIAGCDGPAASTETDSDSSQVRVGEKNVVPTATGTGVLTTAREQVADETKSSTTQKTGAGIAAMEKATGANKYLFALFRCCIRYFHSK